MSGITEKGRISDFFAAGTADVTGSANGGPAPSQRGASAPAVAEAAADRHTFRAASGTRKALVWAVVLIKVVYIAWFYAFGISLNLGDTASYIDASSAEIYLERSGGIGFAYVATLIYSNSVSRLLIEVLTIVVICKLILMIRTDGQAVAATCLVLLPTSLAFMTVASKELLVFLLLFIVYRSRAWLSLPAFVMTAMLKPSFVVIGAFPLVRRLSPISLYLMLVGAAALLLLPLGKWSEIYGSLFYANLSHFSAGDLTYGDPGTFPLTPLLRVLGLDLAGIDGTGFLVGLMVFASNCLAFCILTARYGMFRGTVIFLIFAIAVMPYSVHNLGSAARYQAPLLIALVLNELAPRVKRDFEMKN